MIVRIAKPSRRYALTIIFCALRFLSPSLASSGDDLIFGAPSPSLSNTRHLFSVAGACSGGIMKSPSVASVFARSIAGAAGITAAGRGGGAMGEGMTIGVTLGAGGGALNSCGFGAGAGAGRTTG